MAKCFTAAFLVISTILAAQTLQKTVSGRLTTAGGQPIIGASIFVKGTSVGTTTDAEGNYMLTVPLGSTIVFSFIGMNTREMLVTQAGLIPLSTIPAQSSTPPPMKRPAFTLSADSTKPGVAVLNDKTPVYLTNGEDIDPKKIRSIKPAFGSRLKGTKTFRVRMSTGFGYFLQFSSAIGIEDITQAPTLQTLYAQGRPQAGTAQWRGPETREIFSWGPSLNNLEYNGSDYAYDKNGPLVPAGTGNGRPAQSYDATKFFRTGFSTAHNLTASLQRAGWGIITLDASRKKRTGIIPNSGSTQEHITLQLKSIPLHPRWSTDVNASYDRSSCTLVNRGANFATITGAAWRTPASFDNTNGLSSRKAAASSLSSRMPDGSPRSHAPALADNPYGLIQELPDNDITRRMLAGLIIRYNGKKGFSLTTNSTFGKQWNDIVSGLTPGLSGFPEGRLTHRHERQADVNNSITSFYKKEGSSPHIELSASYHNSYQQRHVNRVDGIGFSALTWGNPKNAESVSALENTLTRATHEFLWNADLLWNDVVLLKLSNRSYFSNTLPASRYTNFFPLLRANVNLDELFESYTFNTLEIFGSFARTIHEAPLIYSNWSYLSTQKPAEEYNAFYESAELFFNRQLSPETATKAETGMRFRVFQRLHGELSIHNNVTRDLLAPAWNTDHFALNNVARVNNYGTTASMGWSIENRSVSFSITLGWARQNSIVKELHSDEAFIPLAGFASTAKVLAAGKPFGAIYGTTYQRNADGRVLIGTDGFPLIDENRKMIGNPIPDWTGTLTTHIEWKKIRLQCVFDIRKGGDVWNGTQAALDYLGRSATTGRERDMAPHVFDGVYENGQTNTTPVSFYDPARPLNENRWVRYGFGSVGESYIEDASWIRLSEIAASHSIKFPAPSKIRELKFSLIANNLLLITGYSGVDPATSLFGYAGNTGLDLFNTPATRTFTAKMMIKI